MYYMEIYFITTILSFPAVIFTILLGIALVYWLLVILGAFDIDMIGDAGNYLESAGLGGIPFTLVMSMLLLIAWVLSVLGTGYIVLAINMPLWQWLSAVAVFFASSLLAIQLTVWFMRPLQQLFAAGEQHLEPTCLIGKQCIITTMTVTERFGQGLYDDRGAGLILQIRAEEPNQLQRGQQALIISYDPEQQLYQIAPEAAATLLGESL